MKFRLKSGFRPTGDQPKAIDELIDGIDKGKRHQTLLGVTGSGKTFTMANVIEKTQRPTLVISHNKTLAAQLYQEFRDFFPENAVSYFVSYYDYYQPEAYIPSTDTYIEKETDINEEIDKLRLSATTNLLTRPDTIVVASVSCIYNLGSPVEYGRYILEIIEGQLISRNSILKRLVELQYDRSDYELKRGAFRVRGETIQIWPAYEDFAVKLVMLEDKIEKISKVDPLTGNKIEEAPIRKNKQYVIYPAKHYITDPLSQGDAFAQIRKDLKERLAWYRKNKKIVEAYRLEQKVNYDLESIQEFGFVNGIENYSRYFDGRKPGEPPFTLLDYFKENSRLFGNDGFLTIVDESHMTLPQIRGMYRGDRSRKETLIDYGFRLPAAIDNRPLRFEEVQARLNQTVYTSATPNEWEVSMSGNEVVEQLIRPTGLVDPEIEIRPVKDQIKDLTREIIKRKIMGERVLVTTLTKKMAEILTEYLNDPTKLAQVSDEEVNVDSLTSELKVQYLHADVETLDRSDILASLRKGEYDVVVGINLLREGLDLPEVSLVTILDADKEGFLRSETSLVQTMGRAARHINGRVIMYADKVTGSMERAIEEVKRRRDKQIAHNLKHNIMPTSIEKPVREELIKRESKDTPATSVIQLTKKEAVDLKKIDPTALTPQDKQKLIRGLTRRMNQAAKEWDFELAAVIRDKLSDLDD
jgi:excinuclease ABC subunit B